MLFTVVFRSDAPIMVVFWFSLCSGRVYNYGAVSVK